MMTVIRNIEKDLYITESETTSPFAIYPNESLKRYEVGAPCHVYLTDLDKVILMVLNKYHVLTSSLLTQAMSQLGLENAEQKDVQSRLKLLANGNFVTKAQFESPDGKSAARCYMLSYRGRGFLKAIGQQVKLTSYIGGLNHIQCKKILAVNQYLIRTNVSHHSIQSCIPVFVPSKTEEKSSLIFRPQATITGEKTIFVEAVRGDDLDFSAISEKLDRMERTLRKKEHNISVNNPELVLVCESASMMRNLMKHVNCSKYHFEIKFTADPLIYEDPVNCIYQMEAPTSFWSAFRKIACF